jgi:prepilin-type processing-associated H-X9-DG protein
VDELIVGYALDALSPAETAAVEAHLAAHPADRAKLDRVRRLLAPLDADRAGYEPPPGLALATVIRVAAHAVEHRLLDADPSAETHEDITPPPMPALREPVTPPAAPPPLVAVADDDPPVPAARSGWGTRRWAEAAVAACVGLLALGLVLTGVDRLRAARGRLACQENLRALHAGLSGYADLNGERFPQVGGPDARTAGEFVRPLAAAGVYPAGFAVVCPAASDAPAELAAYRPEPTAAVPDGVVSRVGYVYTLGFRRDPAGPVLGLRRGDPDLPAARTPLAADLPAAGVGPPALDLRFSPHGSGQNVLYVDGSVMFVTLPTVGPEGDDIYRNDRGFVRAGLRPHDASLGRATDMPE